MTQTTKQSTAGKAYQQFKKKYPDCVLLFRFGDTYEAFFESAEIVSAVCDLSLDSREKNDEDIPLIGLALWELRPRIKEMLQAGHKVAVCERIGDRDVVWIRTPGTVGIG